MSLRHAALGLLAEHPASGYDLLRRFETTMRYVWAATQSQLYAELNRLASDGLIEASAVGARGRKEYAITQAGREELARWIMAPQHEAVRNADLLKIFMLGEVDAGQARTHLQGRVEEAQAALRQLEHVRDDSNWDDSRSDRFARMALEWGLRFHASELEWANWALEQFSGDRA